MASLGCAAATEIWALLAFRLLQGIAAATCMVVPYAVAADLFRGPQLTSIPDCWASRGGSLRVVAPAVGGLLVQYLSWRFVFASIAIMAGAVGAIAFLRLPETLPTEGRVAFHPASAGKALFAALANVRFVAYTAVFGLIASAQLVFGVVAPFLYQQNLAFSAAAYGLIALIIGGANLAGELACTSFATRTSPRQLCFGALSIYFLGALILLVSGLLVGVTMAFAAYLPETSQTPLGWVYLAIGTVAAVLLNISLPTGQILRAAPVSQRPS